MFKIDVERQILANIERVFELLTDHENYQRFKAVEASELIQPGLIEKNGSGAIRKIKNGAFEVIESIVAYERPILMAYQITQSKPFKMNHLSGVISLKSIGPDQTLVNWKSEGNIQVPVIGRFFDAKMEKNGAKVFASILKQVEQMLISSK